MSQPACHPTESVLKSAPDRMTAPVLQPTLIACRLPTERPLHHVSAITVRPSERYASDGANLRMVLVELIRIGERNAPVVITPSHAHLRRHQKCPPGTRLERELRVRVSGVERTDWPGHLPAQVSPARENLCKWNDSAALDEEAGPPMKV